MLSYAERMATDSSNPCKDLWEQKYLGEWLHEFNVPEGWDKEAQHFIIGDYHHCLRYVQSFGLPRDVERFTESQVKILEDRESLFGCAKYFLGTADYDPPYFRRIKIHLVPGWQQLFEDNHPAIAYPMEEVQNVIFAAAISSHLDDGDEIDVITGYPAILDTLPDVVWRANEVPLSAHPPYTWSAHAGRHDALDRIRNDAMQHLMVNSIKNIDVKSVLKGGLV